MSIAVRPVLSQNGNEGLNGIVSYHLPLLFQVLRPKLDLSIRDLNKAMLSDRRPARKRRDGHSE